MPSIDDVYQKFGAAAEAAQLLETELGTMLFGLNALAENLLETKDSGRAAEILEQVNGQTFGQLLKRLGKKAEFLSALESQLMRALEERNRLCHKFYRQHNLRRNSSDGRAIMLRDLEHIHDTLLNAYKAIMLLQGIDLDAIVAELNQAPEASHTDDAPLQHLPI
jgi:hypothetical protein